MSATLSSALCELGASLPRVLDSIVVHGESATALECVKHAACTGTRSVLDAPPPALLHECKLPSSNLLYGAQRPCPVDETAYWHVQEEELLHVRNGTCVGAAMIDLCAAQARAAAVWTVDETTHTRIEIRVYDAPLAAMEVELFEEEGAASGFERRWLGDGAKCAKELRQQVGSYVRSRGYQDVPKWMHSGDYAISRPGVLPLLRLRQSATAAESAAIARLLECEHRSMDTSHQLKDLVKSETRVQVRTVFFAKSRTDERFPQPEEGMNCSHVQTNPVIGAMALLVLKQLDDCDYWDSVAEQVGSVVDAELVDESLDPENEQEGDEQDGDEQDGDEQDGEERKRLQKTVDNMLQQEVGHRPCEQLASLPLRQLHTRGDAVANTHVLGQLGLQSSTRVCGSRLIVRSRASLDQAVQVFRALLSESDAAIMGVVCGEEREAPVERHLFALGSRLVLRQALLVLRNAPDGQALSAAIVAHDGEHTIQTESIVRYAMCPWVTSILVDGDGVYELNIKGVSREKLRLADGHRVSAVQNRIPPSVQEFISEAAQGLKALPGVLSRMEALEKSVNSNRDAIIAPAESAALPDSAISKGLKRTIRLLESYEERRSR